MSRFGVRRRLRSHLASAARRLRAAVVGGTDVAEPDPTPPPVSRSAATVTDGLDPEDVELDAHHVLHQTGIGIEMAFVDVRQPEEIAATGTLPDALRIPLGQLEDRWSELPTDRPVVLVCAAGARSLSGAMALRDWGHDDAWSLVGGLPAWQREGGEVA